MIGLGQTHLLLSGSGVDSNDGDICRRGLARFELLLYGSQQSLIVLVTGLSEFEETLRIECIEVQPLGLNDVLQFRLMDIPADTVQCRRSPFFSKPLLVSELNRLHQEDVVVCRSSSSDLGVLPGSDLDLDRRIKRIGLRDS